MRLILVWCGAQAIHKGLKAAGCSNDQIARYCAGIEPPTDLRNIETGTVIATESGFYDMSGIVEYPPGSGTLVVDLRHNHCGGKLPCTEGKPGEMEYSSTSTDGESPQPALSRRVRAWESSHHEGA